MALLRVPLRGFHTAQRSHGLNRSDFTPLISASAESIRLSIALYHLPVFWLIEKKRRKKKNPQRLLHGRRNAANCSLFLLASQQHHKSGCGQRYQQHEGEESQSCVWRRLHNTANWVLVHGLTTLSSSLFSLCSPPTGRGSPGGWAGEERGGKSAAAGLVPSRSRS